MRIAVCDDSALDRELVCDMLRRYFSEGQTRPELIPYDSGVNLVFDVQEGGWFDVVFLDIYMDGQLGIETAHQLRGLGYAGHIVFLTASPDFAVDSYDVTAAGYLLKPVSFEKLSRVMDRIARNFDTDTYAIRQRSKVIRIPLGEILYVESSNSKCILHRTGGEDYVIYKRLDEIESELGGGRFLRCHQSYLVNMDHVRQVDKQFCLTTGDTVLIRQRDLKAIRETYLAYTGRAEGKNGT